MLSLISPLYRQPQLCIGVIAERETSDSGLDTGSTSVGSRSCSDPWQRQNWIFGNDFVQIITGASCLSAIWSWLLMLDKAQIACEKGRELCFFV